MQSNLCNAVRAHNKRISSSTAILASVTLSLLISGCGTPPQPTTLDFPTNGQTPPAGKSLVIIHRPEATTAHYFSTDVWDGNNMIIEIGNGQSIAYVCEPGKHYFFNRSPEITGKVEADLLPDKIYGLWLEPHMGAWIAGLKLKPITLNEKGWWGKSERVKKQNKWVMRS